MRYYNCYSAWKGRACCMEDIYVEPEWRGKGVGTALWARLTKVSTVDDMHHNPPPVCAVTTDVTCLQGLCAVSMSLLTRVRVVSHDVTPHHGTCRQSRCHASPKYVSSPCHASPRYVLKHVTCYVMPQVTCCHHVTLHQRTCCHYAMPHHGTCCHHTMPYQGACCHASSRDVLLSLIHI